MKVTLFALAAFAGVAFAEAEAELWKKPFQIPFGLELPSHVGPFFAPPAGCIDVFHPPHPNVVIDDCDSDEHEKWHWVHTAKPKPIAPHQKWTTSTVTKTSTKTVIDCPPTVTCPVHKTTVTTVTIPVTTTICPVPITEGPPPPPPKTTSVVVLPPPKTTTPVVVAPPPPVKSTTPAPPPSKPAPPATTPSPIISTVGTVTRPAATPTSSRVVVTAAAVPNAKRAGGALVAVAVAAVALI
jgi:hypothetical protein